MQADRYRRPGGINPGGLGASLGITGLMVLGMIFAAPHITGRPADPALTVTNIPLPPPPPIDPPKPMPKTTRPVTVAAPVPVVIQPLPPIDPIVTLPIVPEIQPPVLGNDIGPVVESSPTPIPPPALIEPALDPRYAGALQPPYPPEERRAEREGRVVVRVLVGVDGRVRQVERVSATSDAFFAVTRAQALSRWRFRPGTRGGVPVEAWHSMALRFVLRDE